MSMRWIWLVNIGLAGICLIGPVESGPVVRGDLPKEIGKVPLTFQDLFSAKDKPVPAASGFYETIGRDCTMDESGKNTVIFRWNDLGSAEGAYEILARECDTTVLDLVIPNDNMEQPDSYHLEKNKHSDAVRVEDGLDI